MKSTYRYFIWRILWRMKKGQYFFALSSYLTKSVIPNPSYLYQMILESWTHTVEKCAHTLSPSLFLSLRLWRIYRKRSLFSTEFFTTFSFMDIRRDLLEYNIIFQGLRVSGGFRIVILKSRKRCIRFSLSLSFPYSLHLSSSLFLFLCFPAVILTSSAAMRVWYIKW